MIGTGYLHYTSKSDLFKKIKINYIISKKIITTIDSEVL